MMLTGSYEVKQLLAGIDSESVTLRCLASVFLYTVKSLFLFRCHAHQYQYYQYKNLIIRDCHFLFSTDSFVGADAIYTSVSSMCHDQLFINSTSSGTGNSN